MSVSSANSALNHVEAEIRREEKKKSDAEVKAARLEKQINDKQREITKNTSASSARSKLNQIKSWNSDLVRARKDASDAGMKLTGLYEKRRKAEAGLRDEQKKEYDQENRKLRDQIDELSTGTQDYAPVRDPNMIMQCVRPLIERFPDAFELFVRAEEKYESGENDRNALDDMRLCFELVLKCLFSNECSLENQKENIGKTLKWAGLSPEFRNMFWTLVDCYCKYQNNHVKHDECINPYEVSFILELTCILMKQLIEQFDQDLEEEE